MSLLTLATLSFSAEHGWAALAARRPPLARLFALLVLPLAPVAPAMLYLAGTRFPDMFPPEVAAKSWSLIAATFLAAEIATLLQTAWLLGRMARTLGLAVSNEDAYLIAGLAPLPLWLSSLALLAGDLVFASAVGAMALMLSCGIVYHGLVGLGQVRERLMAAAITHMVIGAVLVPWTLLLAVALA